MNATKKDALGEIVGSIKEFSHGDTKLATVEYLGDDRFAVQETKAKTFGWNASFFYDWLNNFTNQSRSDDSLTVVIEGSGSIQHYLEDTGFFFDIKEEFKGLF